MLIGLLLVRFEIYQIIVELVYENFKMEVSLNKVNKRELLILDNFNYDIVIVKYSYLKGVRMRDRDIKF